MDLEAKVRQITEEVLELNAELEKTPYSLLRKLNLQTRYYLNGSGSPFPGLGLKPIIPVNKEHERAKAFSSDIDRAAYRDMLRRQKMPEPMIWDRFPARNKAEDLEQIELVTAYKKKAEGKSIFLLKKINPEEAFLQEEAKKSAKFLQKEVEILLKDKEFQRNTRALYKLLYVDMGI